MSLDDGDDIAATRQFRIHSLEQPTLSFKKFHRTSDSLVSESADAPHFRSDGTSHTSVSVGSDGSLEVVSPSDGVNSLRILECNELSGSLNQIDNDMSRIVPMHHSSAGQQISQNPPGAPDLSFEEFLDTSHFDAPEMVDINSSSDAMLLEDQFNPGAQLGSGRDQSWPAEPGAFGDQFDILSTLDHPDNPGVLQSSHRATVASQLQQPQQLEQQPQPQQPHSTQPSTTSRSLGSQSDAPITDASPVSAKQFSSEEQSSSSRGSNRMRRSGLAIYTSKTTSGHGANQASGAAAEHMLSNNSELALQAHPQPGPLRRAVCSPVTFRQHEELAASQSIQMNYRFPPHPAVPGPSNLSRYPQVAPGSHRLELNSNFPGHARAMTMPGPAGSAGMVSAMNTPMSHSMSIPDYGNYFHDYGMGDFEDYGDAPASTRARSVSKMKLTELYERMGLENDHAEAKRREERVIEIMREEGFLVGGQTWIRDTEDTMRKRILNILYERTKEWGYTIEILEIMVRRGTYARMQSKLRQERRRKLRQKGQPRQ